MKVNSSLKSGQLLTDTTNLVKEAAAEVVNLFSNGEQQARTVTLSVASAAQSVWNNLTGWIKLW